VAFSDFAVVLLRAHHDPGHGIEANLLEQNRVQSTGELSLLNFAAGRFSDLLLSGNRLK
jgi:hypothetical protein